MDRDSLAALIDSRLREVRDFPKPGIVFKDFTPLLADPAAMRLIVDDVLAEYAGQVDAIAGIEARGFMIGTACAVAMGVPFLPIRKKGKLPAATFTASYDLEYGSETIEVHQDACGPGQRVLIMDDVLATGGTAAAACELVEKTGAQVVAVDVVCEIEALGGRSRLDGRRVRTLLMI